MNKTIKRQVIYYLVFPLFVSLVCMVTLVLLMGHHTELYKYLAITAGMFLLSVALQIYIFKTKIVPQVAETERIQRLLTLQEESSALLIKRDKELTLANKKLLELDKQKSEFISVAAHQLRTPLAAIRWTLDLMLGSQLGEVTDEQKSFLLKAYQSNERMVRLANDLLQTERVASDDTHYDLVPTQLFDLLDNVAFEIRPLAEHKNIAIEFVNRTTTIPKVSVDPDQMHSAIQNLLDNAIKYTPDDGKIKIKVVHEGELVHVSILDNGMGIPTDQQAQIFSRFYRAPNAVKVQSDGTGLGLFIVKGIIEKHGGKVWFESDGKTGTTFHFTLKAC